MAGGVYGQSFGTRMKDYPKGKSPGGGTPRRTQGWYRCRRYFPVQRGYSKSQKGPWLYFHWERLIRDLPDFTRKYFTSYRDCEFVSLDRPDYIGDNQAECYDHIPMFLEKF